MVSTGCSKFPPVWSDPKDSKGTDGSKTSCLPTAKRAHDSSFLLCSTAPRKKCEIWGQRDLGLNTNSNQTCCVALGKSLYPSGPVSTFKNGDKKLSFEELFEDRTDYIGDA